jgi:hypothetical protein
LFAQFYRRVAERVERVEPQGTSAAAAALLVLALSLGRLGVLEPLALATMAPSPTIRQVQVRVEQVKGRF